MINNLIRVLHLLQRHTFVAGLTARFAARFTTQTFGAVFIGRGFCEPITGRWFAAIRAVQYKPTLQICNSLRQNCVLLSQQRVVFFKRFDPGLQKRIFIERY